MSVWLRKVLSSFVGLSIAAMMLGASRDQSAHYHLIIKHKGQCKELLVEKYSDSASSNSEPSGHQGHGVPDHCCHSHWLFLASTTPPPLTDPGASGLILNAAILNQVTFGTNFEDIDPPRIA
ncbi:MAG: hypothetical protein NTV34_20215 [Proteobacteria bacterium]|nr:hypothetical protein [Pseudomonadota bacterium]